MKKTYLLMAILFVLSSCQDEFLERDPFGSLNSTSFFTKKEHVELAVITNYNSLLYLNRHWASAQLELGMTDDFSSAGFKDAKAFYVGSFNASEPNVVAGVWERAYQGIARCNNNLAQISQMAENLISEADKKLPLAEIRFIRAFWYFRLVQFYGDVPLRLEPLTDISDASQIQLPATKAAKIISEVILPDLIYATENLPQKWDDARAHRATQGAAYAYLTNVYLYLHDWDAALAAGKKVEGLGYALIGNPGDVLRVDFEGSSEIIFSAAFGQGLGTFREYYYGTKEDLGADGRIMRGDTYSADYFYPSNDFINSFETIDGKKITDGSPYYNPATAWKNRDVRFDLTFFTPMDTTVTTKSKVLAWQPEWLVNNETRYDIQKRGVWYGESTWNKEVDIHFIRLPGVYLNMAEAYAQKGEFKMCEEYIEKVRGRARKFALAKKNKNKYVPQGLNDSEVMPKKIINNLQEAMEAIDYESRIEFFTEDCIRYFNLKRWGKLDEKWAKTGGFVWDEKLFNLPIPTAELAGNKELSQNHAGWGN